MFGIKIKFAFCFYSVTANINVNQKNYCTTLFEALFMLIFETLWELGLYSIFTRSIGLGKQSVLIRQWYLRTILYDKEKITPKNHHITSFRGHLYIAQNHSCILLTIQIKKTVKRKLPY